MAAIWAAISSVALAVWLGELLHLGGDHGEALAGLAGPRRLDRRVQRQQVGLPGDVVDQPTTSPIRRAASARPCTVPSVRRASTTASAAIRDDLATCGLISPMDAVSSSVAAETI